MRIGIMLRHIDEKGGVVVYTNSMLRELFAIDKSNQYLLMYKDSNSIGKFSGYSNVQEKIIKMPTKLLWDQIAVPWVARKEKLDMIFNPKFSAPLFTNCKTVIVLHGSEWYVLPEAFKWYDLHYVEFTMPIYCKKAVCMISVSQKITRDFVNYVKVDKNKIKTILHGYDERFRYIKDHDVLERIRKKYNLPKDFILYVGRIYPTKNFNRLLKAYYELNKTYPIKFVIVGKVRWKYKEDIKLIDELKLKENIIFTGWVPDEDLPVIYNLAELFVFPSLYEGFGIPLLEAMACGCPIVTSKTGSPPDIVEDAAVLIDPLDLIEISRVMKEVLTSDSLKKNLIEKGFRRIKKFSWQKCAREVLEVFRELERENN